jgi:hypothetical protein
MKKIFLHFFEIGKLDKGLFRIWIVLTILFCIIAYVDFLGSPQVKKYNKIKSMKCISTEAYLEGLNEFARDIIKKKNNFPDHSSYIIVEMKNDKISYLNKYKLRSRNIWSLYPKYEKYSYFNKLSNCERPIDKIKFEYNSERRDFIAALILFPFVILILWLFSKKIFLWIVRGFK